MQIFEVKKKNIPKIFCTQTGRCLRWSGRNGSLVWYFSWCGLYSRESLWLLHWL